jgi:hypothetical protein
VSPHRSRHSRALVLAIGLTSLAAALGLSAAVRGSRAASVPATVSEDRAPVFPDSIAFKVQYGGIGAEGVDLVWRGRAADKLSGQVTIRMEYAGSQGDRKMPIWPVNAWLFFSADDYRSSFAAELSGSMNWHSGEMRVTGLVSDGARVGTPIEQRIQLRRPSYEGSVTVRFIPRLYSMRRSLAIRLLLADN